MRMHRIYSPMMQSLGYSSKLNAEWAFVLMLKDEGRRAASAFLDADGACLGQRSSFDFAQLLEGVVQ
jgi:NTE family protein